MGQDYAQEEVHHRMYKRPVEKQGQHSSLQAQVCTQLHHEHLFGAFCLLLFRQQGGGTAGACGKIKAVGTLCLLIYPELT